jgi:hypothetical protein
MRRQSGFFSKMELEEVPAEIERIKDIVEEAHIKYLSLRTVFNSDSLPYVSSYLSDAKELVIQGIQEKKKYRSKTAFLEEMVGKVLLWNDVRKVKADIKLLEKTVEDIQEVIMVVNGDFEKSRSLDESLKFLVKARDTLKAFVSSLINFKNSI